MKRNAKPRFELSTDSRSKTRQYSRSARGRSARQARELSFARCYVKAIFFFFFLGCMVASRGGYQMARGRHYAKLSLSNAARLSFSDLCILLFMFLSLCRLCVCVFLCSSS